MPARQLPALSRHQWTILAALRALTEHHDVRWWSRDAIGRIVQAGGYHGVIQRRSMHALKVLGLVITEDADWSQIVRDYVRCTCACCEWGLSALGWQVADTKKVTWDADTGRLIADSFPGFAADRRRDEDEACGWDDDAEEES